VSNTSPISNLACIGRLNLLHEQFSELWIPPAVDHSGTRRQEPTGEADWHEAQKKLRERLQARDDDVLDVIRRVNSCCLKNGRTGFWYSFATVGHIYWGQQIFLDRVQTGIWFRIKKQ